MDVGGLRVELGDWKHPRIESGSDTTLLWKAFIGEKGRRKEIRNRYREMKRAATALPGILGRHESREVSSPEPVQTGRKVGRNEPCPCGSGRKFKRCCGRPK